MSTFEQLIVELTRDVQRVQPKDALQYCSNWFQARLEEQRTRTRDALASRGVPIPTDLPADHIKDAAYAPPQNSSLFSATYTPATPTTTTNDNNKINSNSSSNNNNNHTTTVVAPIPPGPPKPPVQIGGQHKSQRPTIGQGFPGTLNVPGNALLSNPPEDYPDDTSGDFLRPPMSSLGRRVSVSAESGLPYDEELNEPTPVFPKSQEQLKRIKASTSRNFLFRDLNEEQEMGVHNAMQEVKVPAGHVVIRQGDDGNYAYLVEAGLLYCYIREGADPALPEGEVAHDFAPADYDPRLGKKVAVCKPNELFGELALMYNHPRAASVIAVEASTLWRLDRLTFRKIVTQVARRRRKMYEEFLKAVPILSSLTDVERSKIADVLNSEQYADGEAVVKQGDPGDTFYFVEEGQAMITKQEKNDTGEWEEVDFGSYKKGDYFGELALLRTAPRAATVRAVYRKDSSMPRLKCARLGAAAFTRLLGPLRELLMERAGDSYR